MNSIDRRRKLHKWEEEKERVIGLLCIVQIEHWRVWLFELLLFNGISFHFFFCNSRLLLKFLREHVFFYTEGLIERFSCCISWSMCICQKHTINANPRTKKAIGRKIHQRLTIITNNNWNHQIMRQDVCTVQVIVIIWLLLLR